MINLHNPHSEDCIIMFKGKTYTLQAGGVLEVTKELCDYWKDRVHQFLQIVETPITKTKTAKVKAEVEE